MACVVKRAGEGRRLEWEQHLERGSGVAAAISTATDADTPKAAAAWSAPRRRWCRLA